MYIYHAFINALSAHIIHITCIQSCSFPPTPNITGFTNPLFYLHSMLVMNMHGWLHTTEEPLLLGLSTDMHMFSAHTFGRVGIAGLTDCKWQLHCQTVGHYTCADVQHMYLGFKKIFLSNSSWCHFLLLITMSDCLTKLQVGEGG